jgi:hypothetical protein
MRRFRVAALILLIAALLAGVALWSQRRAAGFASPAECVEAYRDACAAGDLATAHTCLGDPLRSESERSSDAESLKREMAGVVSWAQHDPEVSGTTAHVDVDRGRRDGVQRVRFRLERGRGGWLIVGIDPPKDVPTAIPYGTHISKVP